MPVIARYRAVFGIALSAFTCQVGMVWAQPADTMPVVQPLPPAQVGILNDALRRLAANPQDVTALIDAGHASLALDDVDAAVGFFSRAENLAPGSAKAKAGLAAAYVRSENPYDAILLFEQAQKAGASLNDVAADLGLAYDLVGANEQAQSYYRSALARNANPDAEVARRLAVSLAISGDRSGAEAVLLPLLERRDLAAYRARAFALAITGDTKSALDIVNAVMPAQMAVKLAPYMRYMPRLTPAQQAAAANFGHFPRTADIGRDDPRIARYQGRAVSPGGADAALVPAGEPLGKRLGAETGDSGTKKKKEKKKAKQEGNAALAANGTMVSVPALAPPPPYSSASQDSPAVARIERIAPPPPAPMAQPSFSIAPAAAPATSELPPVVPASPPAPSQTPVPSFDLSSIKGSSPSQPAVATPVEQHPAATLAAGPAPAPTQEAAPAPIRQEPVSPPASLSVADAFADLAPPPVERQVAAGAVDITRIKPRREEPPAPKVEAKPKPPAHPSRVWVQLATGRDIKALGFDWRRFSREAPGSLKGRKAFTTKWGQANRLLTGPFDTSAAAGAMVKKLKDEGVDSFTFTSEEGQEISPLQTGK